MKRRPKQFYLPPELYGLVERFRAEREISFQAAIEIILCMGLATQSVR